MHLLDLIETRGDPATLGRPAPFGPIAPAGGLGEGRTPLAAFDAALRDAASGAGESLGRIATLALVVTWPVIVAFTGLSWGEALVADIALKLVYAAYA